MHWVIIGPLVVFTLGMLMRLWYVAGTAPRVGTGGRHVADHRRALGDRQ